MTKDDLLKLADEIEALALAYDRGGDATWRSDSVIVLTRHSYERLQALVREWRQFTQIAAETEVPLAKLKEFYAEAGFPIDEEKWAEMEAYVNEMVPIEPPLLKK